jgi:hypothetical protein
MSSATSRKKRSIGRVARDMLAVLPASVEADCECVFSVAEVMAQLGCCRGAVYEVIHVLEALLLVTKVVFRPHLDLEKGKLYLILLQIGTNLFRWNGYVILVFPQEWVAIDNCRQQFAAFLGVFSTRECVTLI